MAFVDEGAAQPTGGAFSWPLGAGEAVTAYGGGGGGLMNAFDMSDGKIVNCGLAFGRRWIECEDVALPALGSEPSGAIYAEISHGGGSVTLTVKHGARLPDNSLDVTHRLLYKASSGSGGSGRSWIDCRAAPAVSALD